MRRLIGLGLLVIAGLAGYGGWWGFHATQAFRMRSADLQNRSLTLPMLERLRSQVNEQMQMIVTFAATRPDELFHARQPVRAYLDQIDATARAYPKIAGQVAVIAERNRRFEQMADAFLTDSPRLSTQLLASQAEQVRSAGAEIAVLAAALGEEILDQIESERSQAEADANRATLIQLWLNAAVVVTALLALRLTILERSRLSQEIAQLKSSDPLTGAMSREHFVERANQEYDAAVAMTRPVAVVIVDGDRFREVNATHGRHIGDAALRYIAILIRAELLPGDLLGRTGGGEFTVLLHSSGRPEAAELVAERIRSSVAEAPMLIALGSIGLKVSVGMALSEASDRGLADLIHRADEALYQDQEAGAEVAAGRLD